MKYSIIIPTYNNSQRLELCLEALVPHVAATRAEGEVIVVDNESTDELSAVQSRFDQVKWLTNDKVKSPYVSRNIGISQARGDWVVLLDANCIPAEKWLETGLEMMAKQAKGIGSGPIHFEIENRNLWQLIDAISIVPNRYSYEDGRSYAGANLVFPRQMVTDIGLFAESRSGADTLFTAKGVKAGYPLVFHNKFAVSYRPKHARAFMKKAVRIGTGYSMLYRKGEKSLPSLLKLMIIHLLPSKPSAIITYGKMHNLQLSTKEKVACFFGFWWYKWLKNIGILKGLVSR